MTKEFIGCLERIIELEKTSITQEKTLKSLNEAMENLGKAKNIEKPVRKKLNKPPVQYDSQKTDFISFFVLGAVIGTVICGTIMGTIIILFRTEIGIGTFFKYIIAGGTIGGTLLCIILSKKDKKAKQEAERDSQRQYEQAINDEGIRYSKVLQEYNERCIADAERVKNELVQKDILSDTLKQLSKKHEETRSVLTKFYDTADIYDTYRNLIAISHICEYLKSGICSELTGHDGAFMTFKYEMFEKMKIEQLGSIMSKLDELHFDNQILNRSLQDISTQVSRLDSSIEDMKRIQINSAQKNQEMLGTLSSQLGHIEGQNEVIQYNTYCTANELNYLTWLEYYKELNK